jgi:hypothetical protein
MDILMKKLESSSLASMEFALNWQSAEAKYRLRQSANHRWKEAGALLTGLRK